MVDLIQTAENSSSQSIKKAAFHYFLANRYKQKNTNLGITVTLFTSVVGTTIFASLASKSSILSIQIITGVLSVIASALSAFQIFFKFSESSTQHKTAATAYESISRKFDLFVAMYSDKEQKITQADKIKDLQSINSDLNKIDEVAPTIPNSAMKKFDKGDFYFVLNRS